MPIYHFIPEEETFESRIMNRLANCKQAILASAFFTFGALQSIKPVLEDALSRDVQVKFLLGRFDFVTEPRAVEALLALSNRYPKKLHIYFDADFRFHYKLAIFKSGNTEVVIIGSSNMTPKGMSSIGEVNLEIEGNNGVYKQAHNLLKDRIRQAIPAQEIIAEYRKKYIHAKKYRDARLRWYVNGKKTWPLKKDKPRSYSRLSEAVYPFCEITDLEEDTDYIENIEKERSKSKSQTDRLLKQWVHPPKKIANLIKEGNDFVVLDHLGRSLGFAVCKRKITVFNEKNKLEPVIYFRYHRGWKAEFHSKSEFEKDYAKLGLNKGASKIETKLLNKLKGYLIKRSNKSK